MSSPSQASLQALLYLWPKRTLFIGQLAEKAQLQQGSATLTISLDQPIRLTLPGSGKTIESRSILLPAGFQVSVETGDAVIANCNLDVFGRDFAGLIGQAQKHSETMGFDLINEEELQRVFKDIRAQSGAPEIASKMLDEALTGNAEIYQARARHKVDPRVERVIELVQNTASENISLDALASEIKVSSQRLIQLFKQQTGIPIRRYRLWHRMFRTAIHIAQGATMTDAALAAGFSDSAHFAHTFRSMFGTTPSNIFLNRKQLKIYFGL